MYVHSSGNNSFYPASKFSIVMGNLDRSLNNGNTLKLSVSKITIGNHFNTESFQDDLAIMFLNQSIPENFTGAEVIELNQNFNLTDGEICLVTGWGLTEKVSKNIFEKFSRKIQIHYNIPLNW